MFAEHSLVQSHVFHVKLDIHQCVRARVLAVYFIELQVILIYEAICYVSENELN